jgi:hypothetical protein
MLRSGFIMWNLPKIPLSTLPNEDGVVVSAMVNKHEKDKNTTFLWYLGANIIIVCLHMIPDYVG